MDGWVESDSVLALKVGIMIYIGDIGSAGSITVVGVLGEDEGHTFFVSLDNHRYVHTNYFTYRLH